MGHQQRNANRAARIEVNKARILKIARTTEGLVKEWTKHQTHHVEVEKKIEWLADELADEHATTNQRLYAMAETVRFNALPFWKRWWQTKRDDRAAMAKDSQKAMFLGAIEVDRDRDKLDPALGSPVQVDVDELATEIKRTVAAQEEHDKAEAADRQHDAEREATLAGDS